MKKGRKAVKRMAWMSVYHGKYNSVSNVIWFKKPEKFNNKDYSLVRVEIREVSDD